MLRTGCSGVGHAVDCTQRQTKRTKVSAAAKLCGGEHWKRKQILREMDRPAKLLSCAASREVASSHAPASSDSAEIMGTTFERYDFDFVISTAPFTHVGPNWAALSNYDLYNSR